MTGKNREDNISAALYHAALGKMVLDYVGGIHPTVMERAMESRAVQTLEAIRRILQDERFSDPECFEVVDTLVMQFFKELEIDIDRHTELA